MMTKKEQYDEFWLLTKSVLQDSKIDADEARVIKRWLEEHRDGNSFDFMITKLEGFLSDGYVDRFESTKVIDALGCVLRQLSPGGWSRLLPIHRRSGHTICR